jgi:hypothetical protein
MSAVKLLIGARDFSQKSLHQLWDPSRLLSVGTKGYFQECKVVGVQGLLFIWCWGSEWMERCWYSLYMPSRHGQGQLDFHNFSLPTTSVMWLHRCETFTLHKSNAYAFWSGAFLKCGGLEDLSAIKLWGWDLNETSSDLFSEEEESEPLYYGSVHCEHCMTLQDVGF